MKLIKLAALAAVALSPAHAADPQDFCLSPLTPIAVTSLHNTQHFRAYPEQLTAAVNDFCWLGMEEARAHRTPEQVAARADIEAARWVQDKYGNDHIAADERQVLISALYFGMQAGYTLQQQPPQELVSAVLNPNGKPVSSAAAAKAAAEKAAAAKKAAAEKAAAEKAAAAKKAAAK